MDIVLRMEAPYRNLNPVNQVPPGAKARFLNSGQRHPLKLCPFKIAPCRLLCCPACGKWLYKW